MTPIFLAAILFIACWFLLGMLAGALVTVIVLCQRRAPPVPD